MASHHISKDGLMIKNADMYTYMLIHIYIFCRTQQCNTLLVLLITYPSLIAVSVVNPKLKTRNFPCDPLEDLAAIQQCVSLSKQPGPWHSAYG